MARGEVRSVVVRERAGCAIAVALNDNRGRAFFSYNDGAASANVVLNAARGGKVSRADMAAEVGRGETSAARICTFPAARSINRSINPFFATRVMTWHHAPRVRIRGTSRTTEKTRH